MHELGIIFMHHNTLPITLDHFERVKSMNPGCPVIPLSGSSHTLPGGHSLLDIPSCFERSWQKETNNGEPVLAWGAPDLALYQWHNWNKVNKIVECKRWAVMEWDTKCCMSWEKFWEPVWDAPSAGIKVFETNKPGKWTWFEQIPKMPERYRSHALGIYLFGALLISDSAFTLCTQAMQEEFIDAFSELRLGTLLNYVWKKPVAHPGVKGYIHYDSRALIGKDTDAYGIWHPVKNLPVVYDHPVYGRIVVNHLKVTITDEDGNEIGDTEFVPDEND